MASKKADLKAVVVRAYSGVFFGYLVERRGGGDHCEVDLVRARHIHRWQSNGLPRKALNCEDLAILGAGEGTTIGGEVSQTILDVKVIIDATEAAIKQFDSLPNLA